MTALDKYALLEAEAVYFDGQSARPREVIVRFGETTLTLLTFDDEPVHHWALASLRLVDAVAPKHAQETLRLAPGHDGEERLTLTDPEMIAALRQVCPDLEAPAAPPSRVARKALIWGVSALGAIALLALVIAPMAAEQLALRLPQDRAERLGVAVLSIAAVSMGADNPPVICETPEGLAALTRLTARLQDGAGARRPITVQVIRSPAENAITVPGGMIAIMSGLIDRAQSPEEVAAVLAHEIAHAEARDPLREAFRVIGTAGLLGLAVGDYAGGAVVATLSEAVVSGAYQRDAEAAADARALEILNQAGLPGAALADVFDRFARNAAPDAGLLSHLATHPDPAGRAAEARAADRIGAAPFTPALEDGAWIALQQICD
jgi:Zn-dependent protease with chaperone function